MNDDSRVTIGNVSGHISGKIAGRDIVEIVIQLVQQTGGQMPSPRNLPAQAAALRQALPQLDSAARASVQTALDHLAQAIADLPRCEQAYLDRLKNKYAEEAGYYIPLSGRTTEILPASLSADTPRAARRRDHRAEAEYHEWIATEREIQRVKLNTLREGVDKYPCLILLGDPGCGKTTALEHLAYQFASESSPLLPLRQAQDTVRSPAPLLPLPIPLRLSDFTPGLTLEDWLAESWGGSIEGGHWGASELAANLEGYLEAGRLFFLFDALNEMPRDGYRERAAALRRFIDRWRFKGNRFLVTCRILDYGGELSGLQRIEIQPLTDEQIQAFLQNELPNNWHTLWKILTDNPAIQNLKSKIQNLLELARNPYLLTMIIDIFLEDGQLGQNRADLLTRFTHILLAREKAKCPPAEWLDAAAQRESLSVLAFEMQQRAGSGAAVETTLVKTVLPLQVQIDPKWPPIPAPPDQVLTLAARANLIEMPVDRASVRFYHQVLQEYFAARQLLKQINADLRGLTDLGGLEPLWRWPWLEPEMPLWVRPEGNRDPLPPPPPTGWEETTILAAGLGVENDNQLVQTLIRVNPVLAGRCLHEGKARVDKAVRQAVIQSLISNLSDPEVALRVRIAAGEVLGYLGDPRLGEMVTIPAGKFLMGDKNDRYAKPQHPLFLPDYRIGKYPLTNAEYRRFIEAGGYNNNRWWTEAGWKDVGQQQGEPRYWQDNRFNKPNQPLVGVSWYECVAYCHWLSTEMGLLYRLSTEAEWEKAARGVDGRQYPWGNRFDAGRLNINEGKQIVNSTTPVGLYPDGISPFGVFDCAGNVWEWCATTKVSDFKLKPYPYDTTEDEWSPDYLNRTDIRVLRGSSWGNDRPNAHCACRVRHLPDSRLNGIGCRLVASPNG